MNLADSLKVCVRRGWHLASPVTRGITLDYCNTLSSQDEETKLILAYGQNEFPEEYAKAGLATLGAMPAMDEGQWGPATERLVENTVAWCRVPDILPASDQLNTFEDPDLAEVCKLYQESIDEAVGPGNWPRCHNVGDFHSVVVEWDLSLLPDFLKPHFPTILKYVQAAYAEVGIVPHFQSSGRNLIPGQTYVSRTANVQATFVRRSSGWIGLATVRNGLGCGDTRSWCRYLRTYQPRGTVDLIRLWFVLIMHELGHNWGTGHINGTIMHPSIGRAGSTADHKIKRDRFWNWLAGRYGGLQAPVPDGDGPPPDDPPPDSVERRLRDLEEMDISHTTRIDLQLMEIRRLRDRVTKLELKQEGN